MNGQKLSLHPFPSSAPHPDIQIICNVARDKNVLAVNYEITGSLSELAVPSLEEIPVRRTGLWEETCLELFIGARDSERYWEFNLSPSGHWNVFCFDDYRQGMHDEAAFTSMPFSIHSRSDNLVLDLKFDSEKIIHSAQPLEAAVSAVIKQKNGEVTYWSLTHPGAQADFHCRDSFIVKL